MTLDTNVYATASQTLSCKIDKTPPTTSLSGSYSSLEGTHSDNLSGVTGYVFTTSTAGASTLSYTSCDAITESQTRYTGVSQNTRTYFYVHDAAGNYSSSKSATWKGTCTQTIRSSGEKLVSVSYNNRYCAYCGKYTTTYYYYNSCPTHGRISSYDYFCTSHASGYQRRYYSYNGNSASAETCGKDNGYTYY